MLAAGKYRKDLMRALIDKNRCFYYIGTNLHIVENGAIRSHGGLPKANPYGPTGLLTYDSKRNTVWVGSEEEPTIEVDISLKKTKKTSRMLADAALVGDLMWAVTGRGSFTDGKYQRRRLVQIDARGKGVADDVLFPPIRGIRWPFGPAYQFGGGGYCVDPLDAHYTVRIKANEFGVCVASGAGFIFGFPVDGEPFGWQFPSIYQGWLVAELTKNGVLATACQNGRTGEVISFDRKGCWQKAFDSSWSRVSPAVLSHDSIVMGWEGDSAVVIGGHPLTVTTKGVVAARIVDTYASGGKVAWCAENSIGHIYCVDGIWQSWRYGQSQPDLLTEMKQAPDGVPWTWTRETNDVLAISIPDKDRMNRLLDCAKSGDLEAINADIVWPAVGEDDLENGIYSSLMRDGIPYNPNRDIVRLLAQRVVEAEDPFLAFQARDVFPGKLPNDLFSSIDDVLDVGLIGNEDKIVNKELEFVPERASILGKFDGVGLLFEIKIGYEKLLSTTIRSTEILSQGLTTWYSEDERAPLILGRQEYESNGDSVPVKVSIERSLQYGMRVYFESLDRTFWGEVSANFRGIMIPENVSDEVAMVLASRQIDLKDWYIGQGQSGRLLTVFEADLVNAKPCQPKIDLSVAKELIDIWVQSEQLALGEELSEDVYREIQWTIFRLRDPYRIVSFLEERLLEFDQVEDLFGTTEELMDKAEHFFVKSLEKGA